MKITLANDFHGTTAAMIANPVSGHTYRVSGRIVKRMRSELCGLTDCMCGGNFGERGRQEVSIEVTGVAEDGGYTIEVDNGNQPKRGPGKPRLVPGEETTAYQVRMGQELADKALQIGGGKLAEGVRKALAEYKIK
jgi:hypothetical protein